MKKTGLLPRAALAAMAIAAAACLPWGLAAAQNNVIYVPVTYYDYRSDGSNPEFEQPHVGGLRAGMVERILDADFKPVATAPQDNMMNQGIRFWFRDWDNLSRSQRPDRETYLRKFRPIYMYRSSANSAYNVPPPRVGQNNDPAAAGIYNTGGWDQGSSPFRWTANAYGPADTTIGNNTYTVENAFENRVIRDSLRFELQPNGLYRFSRSEGRGTGSFFPIDNRGFGNEGRNHNFSYTMEMVYPFEAKAGMVFNFSGDDDVWVFINNTLVLDIGGIHGEEPGSFRLDAVLAANQMGQEHTLRVFYAERHTTGSNIHIETNIVSPPGNLQIVDANGQKVSTIRQDAGDSTKVFVELYDETNTIKKVAGVDYQCKDITWTIVNPCSNRSTTVNDCEVWVKDTIACSTMVVRASYKDPAKPNLPAIRDSADMRVNPLGPAYIRIHSKDTAMTPSKVVNSDHGDPIYFTVKDSTATAYALLYDKYGNYVPWDSPHVTGTAGWGSGDPNIATVAPDKPNGSQATVTKQAEGAGADGYLRVTYNFNGTILRDSVFVGTVRDPAIGIGPNPSQPNVSRVDDLGQNTKTFYNNAVRNSGGGAGNGALIAVDAPKQLKEQSGGKTGLAGGKPFGKIIIYDAVGNVVRSDNIYKANDRPGSSYGYVWDWKTQKGRTVAPGTYLIVVTGVDIDGNKFSVRGKAGVTKR